MKAIIPVAGIGSRLRPQTHTQPKALVPVAGKPILGHIIDSLADGGIKEFIFVIGYLGDKIQQFVSQKYSHLNIQFVVQEFKEGAGHAIWMAKELIKKDDELLIVLGDTIFDVNLKEVIESPYSELGVKKVDDPRLFGVVEMNENGMVTKVVEKPVIPKSNLALVGIYKIKEGYALIEALDYNIKHNIKSNDQFYITDGLMRLLDQGVQIHTFPVEDWYDCGKKEVLLATNAMLLAKQPLQKAQGTFENTIIVPPVSIAENCKISNSIIGPNVSIGENTIVNYSIVHNSIIGAYSNLESIVLDQSLIGNDVSLKGLSQSLNLGDSTEISFS